MSGEMSSDMSSEMGETGERHEMRSSTSGTLGLGWHLVLWAATCTLFCMTGAFAVALVQDLVWSTRPGTTDLAYVLAFALPLVAVVLVWRRYWFRPHHLKRLVTAEGGAGFRRRRSLWADRVEARLGDLWMLGVLNRPIVDFWPAIDVHRRRPRELPEDMLQGAFISFFYPADFSDLGGCRVEIDTTRPVETGVARLDTALAKAVAAVSKGISSEGVPSEGIPSRDVPALRLELTGSWLRVEVDGGAWLGSRFGDHIEAALAFTRRLVGELAPDHPYQEPQSRDWPPVYREPGHRLAPIGNAVEPAATERHGARRAVLERRSSHKEIDMGTLSSNASSNASSRIATPIRRAALTGLLVFGGALAGTGATGAQAVADGAVYLAGAQQADGSWTSAQVRGVQATTEALRALQAVGLEPAAQTAAADFLEFEPVLDNDDRARRLGVLSAAGRDVSTAVTDLVAARALNLGWGLTADFASDPLDTALALQSLPVAFALGDETLRRGLGFLLTRQKDDGGFPCVDTGDDDADSQIFCASHALLAVVPFRTVFFVDPEITATVDFLRAQLQPDGSFGPAGSNQVIHTALASLALASVPAFGSEVANVISFLEGSQQPDGSWQGDPYVTALALRALDALAAVPFCGDGIIDQPGEACDGLDFGGLTCEGVGLGAGTLACSAQCTLDTSGCAEPPICGDNLRNQPFEICDGTDLAAETCESLGFASGTLACATDCLSFNVGGCNAEASCGDGVVNLPGELCDLSDLNGQTCDSLGLGGGLLQCASDCNLDTSQCDAAGFEIDNKGREFFVGFLRNFSSVSATAALHLTSDVPTTATIQYPVNNPTFVRNVAVTPGQVTVVNLPRAVHNSWATGLVRNNAVRVSGPDELVVYLVNRQFATSDAGMALPVDALGTQYFVTTARSSVIVSSDRSEFLVVAPFDDTTVTITPTTTMRFLGTSAPAGVPVQVTLSRGQGLRTEAVFARTDLTGTLIEADRPVAVVNGNVCTNVPSNVTFCDHIFEVAHPVRSWGETALVTNLPNRSSGSVYRVVASTDGTEVLRDGVLQTTLDRGEFLETGPITGNHVFAGSAPIFVTQFMTGDSSPGAINGDPAMANMIPPDQYLEKYTFSTVGGGQFGSHFLTVTAPDSSLGSLLLDGNPIAPGAFSPVGSSGFSSAVVPLSEGSHTTASPEPHGITVEGLNPFDSYIYPGGARLEFINQFCGDGEVNLSNEECDGSDFEGATCASFGFSAGFLQCTVDCRIDTSQCSGISTEDEDDDGFPATEDCDDRDPEVNPGMAEIPGNGVDDDCNPATPDEVPDAAVTCELTSSQIAYLATDVIALEGVIENNDDTFSFTGLTASLTVLDNTATGIFDETRDLTPLPSGARAQLSFALAADANPPGAYQAELTVSSGLQAVAVCSAGFAIESSADTGAGLIGTLALDPDVVDAGDPSDADYTVTNRGNAPLLDIALRVILVDPVTGSIVAELLDTTSLEPGESFSASQVFSTVDLETNKSYLAVLLGTPSSTGVEQTLDSASLTVVNAPPDCSEATAVPASLWPPNHKLVVVGIEGVTDPDGDPVTLTVTGVFQDERTDDLGSGDTCPDATGVGTPVASVRAERSGRQDGRVYHLFFEADDGRGGTCEGEVTVCVSHDQKADGGQCVDEGALFDSTSCG